MAKKEKEQVSQVAVEPKDWNKELQDDFKSIKKRMHDKLEEFSISRLNPVHFHTLKVENEGQLCSLIELASVNLEKARLLLIKPYTPNQKVLHEIEKAIKKAKPNITINLKENEFRCSIPEPTAEIREERIKSSKQIVEEAKIAVRNKRKDIQKHFKSWYSSENERNSNQNLLEKEVSKYLAEIDSDWTRKEKEFRSI
ncbi:ribosome recycling factor [Candidatus Mycoplasma haematolamae str. Purdue]|uniref:Ribosome recycling factor n=1 Tax=Mycoplasma haematolamae (strain Purdue) TaxID=1212765 RepID=I7BJ58_MYCHA|nr:ribosome-recycling factor [Candidatus Mycoplasma haematolamae]AFO51873.1 ribosome recycling factor [Candidatus Mycoplasma haematolamae str. Purdue]